SSVYCCVSQHYGSVSCGGCVVDRLNSLVHFYVWEACVEEFGFEPGLDPFKPPALGGEDSNVDVVEVGVLVDAILADWRVVSDPGHQPQAEIAVDCCDAPAGGYKLPPLTLTQHT